MAGGPSRALNIPAAIGRFQPRRVLGEGGQGIVYHAFDPQLDRDVALKVLSRHGRDPTKLLNEARNVAKLDHPGIVALFEIALDHEPPYLVYQFVSGRPLTEYLTPSALLPINRIVQLMLRVLDAIDYAHQRNVLHRDLTPANVLLDDADEPRILDFGIAVALSEAGGPQQIAGTPNYLAPEVLANQAIGAPADLFSLAVVMHELLSGRRLFTADNPMAVIYKILNERILPPSLNRDGIDAELDRIVMQGLERDPAQRYASAAAMRDALRAYLKPQSAEHDAVLPVSGDASGAVAFLRRRMARKPDFPAVSHHIAEINRKADERAQSHVNDLASVVLKDYALTTKLLKIVNSAVYGQYGGSISTVSRAVVILGLEQVRALALGIIIFEHMKTGEQTERLKEAACSSFLSALLARSLAGADRELSNSEEAFVSAMFHRLGKHIAIYYFPDEIREVEGVIEAKGVDENVAAREIFGSEYADLGIAIAREWNLPERIVNAMRPQRAPKIKAGKTPDARIAQLAAFSNEVAEIAGGGQADLDQRLNALLTRYAECVQVDLAQLKQRVVEAVAATRDYAELMGGDLVSSPLLGRVKRAMGDGNVSHEGLPAVVTDDDRDNEDTAAESPHGAANRRQTFLANAISELTTAIIERAPVNDLFTMVLEAFYRSMGFTRVLFLIRDPARRGYVTRFGFGADADQLKGRFEFKLDGADDVFTQAARKGRNAVIIDTDDERYRDAVPAWCRQLTAPRSLLTFAVIVNKLTLGVIYADSIDEPVRINAQDLQLLNTLVKQLTLGVHQR
jgi:serine/threonine protein kinase